MFDFAALDVALGLIFVYLVLSLVCTAANEALSSVFAWRADTLREGIENLLGSEAEREKLYKHPLVAGLIRQKGGRLSRWAWPKRTWIIRKLPAVSGRYPSYLPARAFATALLHPVAEGEADADVEAHLRLRKGKKGEPNDDERITAAIAGIGSLDTQNALKILREISDDADKFKESLERWFDDSMARVSGWYRRRIQVWLWAWAILVTGALHADTIQIAQTLWTDESTRAAVVARAESVSSTSEVTDTDLESAARSVQDLEELQIPLGWADGWPDWANSKGEIAWVVLINAFGLGITAVALTLGAPFWFDTLKKVANIRAAGKAPAEKQVEKPGEAGEPAKS